MCLQVYISVCVHGYHFRTELDLTFDYTVAAVFSSSQETVANKSCKCHASRRVAVGAVSVYLERD